MTPSAPAVPPQLLSRVRRILERTRVFDIHTHLYDPGFGSLVLSGIDDLLVYHYLVAEAFRFDTLAAEVFWQLPKAQQAERVWQALFVERSPVSEACRGVVTTLNRMGLEARRRDLPALRRWFGAQPAGRHLDRVLELAGVERLCMTNSPFDDEERPVWERGLGRDERFVAALRVDPLLTAWPEACGRLRGWGYLVERRLTGRTLEGVRAFLRDWSRRIGAAYLMVSLPPEFEYPGGTECARLIEGAVLPWCREAGLPFAVMLGVKRAVNPALRLAGDGVGRSNLAALQALCGGHPENRFLATVLSRENQHEFCVLARKFGNLHPFGCWWFTNVPVLIDEITRQRLELLGTSFTAQHSDARVLDQLVYKWAHFREALAPVLAARYQALAASGWQVLPAEMERDAQALLGGEFRRFCGDSVLDGRKAGS